MFRLIEPSPGQTQNIVLVHTFSECTHKYVHPLNVPVLCFIFGLMMAQ